jgi:hypothetical protein
MRSAIGQADEEESKLSLSSWRGSGIKLTDDIFGTYNCTLLNLFHRDCGSAAKLATGVHSVSVQRKAGVALLDPLLS